MIPMIDLKKNYHSIEDEIIKEIQEVMESSQFILGRKSSLLEEQVRRFIDAGNALSLASGTDALHMAVRALDIKSGDEVITTPFTFFATAEAIAYTGAIPVFVDIEEDTFNINPMLIEEKITNRTKAVIPVHLFGHPANMGQILDIAGRHGLRVIEDCAQSFGASIDGRMTGSFGDAGCFSFYPSKNLGAYGDGGMIVLRDPLLGDLIKRYRNHGSLGHYRHETIGYNSRLDEIQAAVLLVKMKRIREYNEQRRRCAHTYNSLLDGAVTCPTERAGAHHVYHQYTIRSHNRDHIRETLKSHNIASVVYYPIPLHLQEGLSYLGYKEGDFPAAERASKEVLSLPIYPELENDDIHNICRIIKESL